MPLYDYARAAIAAGLPDGPFRGVPFLMKDLTASIAGVRMTRSSRFFADAPPPAADSEHVVRLKRAGLVIFGRTNTCELGLSLTCEPQLYGAHAQSVGSHAHLRRLDRRRRRGGGRAHAAAWRTPPTASARSARRPPAAGWSGSSRRAAATPWRPTPARDWPACSAEHAVTLTVRDSAALLDATCGPGAGDPYVRAAPARPLSAGGRTPIRARCASRGPTKAPNGAHVDAERLRVLRETAKLCADLGHQVEEADPVVDGAAVVPTFLTLAAANTVVNLASHPTAGRTARPGEVEKVTFATGRSWRAHHRRGLRARDADRAPARPTDGRVPRRLGRPAHPGLATVPVKLGWIDMMLDDVDEYWRRVFNFSPFTVWFNLTGQPATMLPLGTSPEGLPVAVQFVARFGDEATLFRLAAQLESARPWIGRRPPVAA